MHNGVAAIVLALTMLGVTVGTVVQTEERRGEMARVLARVEHGLREIAGGRPVR